MAKWRWISVGVLLAWVGAVLTGSVWLGAATIGTQATPRVFELRTYTAQPGKFDGMKARFREHIILLFKRHNLTVVGFWTYADPPASQNTLVYILSHESRQAAEKNWAAFLADPVRQQVWQQTERDGPINMKVESVFLNPIDFSPIK